MTRIFKLHNFFKNRWDDDLDPNDPKATEVIYIVREDDIVFYIGQTTEGIHYRIDEHRGLIGRGRGCPSVLGKYINEIDNSDDWTIELVAVKDFPAVVPPAHRERIERLLERYDYPLAIDETERLLIEKYRPCLNGTHNPNPTPLPPKHQERELAQAVERRRRGRLRYG